MLNKWIREEEAQASLEYVLILMVVVSLFVIFHRMFMPLWERLRVALDKKIETQMTKGLHSYPRLPR